MANKQTTPLTDTKLKSLKPQAKAFTLSDGDGLQIRVKPDGRKIWEIRYTLEGVSKQTTFGSYPTVSLKEARLKRDEIRSNAFKGIAHTEERRQAKEAQEAQEATQRGQIHLITYEWLSTLKTSEGTATKRKRAFERDLFPHFCTYDGNHAITSSRLITDISHGEIATIISLKGQIAPETASRLFADIKALWNYAVSHDYTDHNITQKIDKASVPKATPKHYPKITDEATLGELLRSIDNYQGIVRQLLRLVALVPLRAKNISMLRWSQVDLEREAITIPRQEMKIQDKNLPDFTIPLSKQAVKVLKEIHPFTGWQQWVFHGVRNNKAHINPESPNKALRIMGFSDEARGRKQTLHSFRGTFRSLTETHADKHKAHFEVREAVLDHHDTRLAVRAYTHKADYVSQMRVLLQWWGDYLDHITEY